ncbi:unnamed protein product [Vicia faba]|uniref:Uncharacterized protein n=1 Tax=Vicia faba TaxID=3906 RepID=A0AAV1A1G2_VICFA|nr:unnamed protein product [Vicia faba]
MDIHSLVNAVDDVIISKLGSTFATSLHMQDDHKLVHVSDEDDIGGCHVGEGHECDGFEQETKLKLTSLKEYSTFPCPDMVLPSSSSDDEEADTPLTKSPSNQSLQQSYSCSASQPASPKLVSAMKGSREKLGGLETKLSVKWASDVYDPIPTLSSHTVRIKKQPKSRIKKSEKKYVKKGQKGTYSKGGSGKDKKQHYRYSWPESCGKGFDASKELNNLDVVGHDSYHEISNSKIPSTEKPCHVGEAFSNILDFVSYIKSS